MLTDTRNLPAMRVLFSRLSGKWRADPLIAAELRAAIDLFPTDKFLRDCLRSALLSGDPPSEIECDADDEPDPSDEWLLDNIGFAAQFCCVDGLLSAPTNSSLARAVVLQSAQKLSALHSEENPARLAAADLLRYSASPVRLFASAANALI
jgi:hypothetical protein